MENTNKMGLKEFEKFLKICRKYGVIEIDFNGVKARLNEKELLADNSEIIDDDKSDSLTDEQLMFYSAGAQ